MHSLSHSISEKIFSISILLVLHISSSCSRCCSSFLLVHIVLLLVVVVPEPEVIVSLVESEIIFIKVAEGCWWRGRRKRRSVSCW